MEIFKNLSEEMIKELIPKIGTRYKFAQKWKLFTSPMVLADNIIFTSIDAMQVWILIERFKIFFKSLYYSLF